MKVIKKENEELSHKDFFHVVLSHEGPYQTFAFLNEEDIQFPPGRL